MRRRKRTPQNSVWNQNQFPFFQESSHSRCLPLFKFVSVEYFWLVQLLHCRDVSKEKTTTTKTKQIQTSIPTKNVIQFSQNRQRNQWFPSDVNLYGGVFLPHCSQVGLALTFRETEKSQPKAWCQLWSKLTTKLPKHTFLVEVRVCERIFSSSRRCTLRMQQTATAESHPPTQR